MIYGRLRGLMIMFFILLGFRAQNFGQNYIYTQNFETTNPFKYWTSNATYTINYFGLSSDRAVDGTKSLKMDITINGSGDKDCYYYWTLPVKINLNGQMDFSAYIWMDSETAKYVKLGYNYQFQPTGLQRTPGAVSVTQYNTWFKQTASLSDDVVYHADYFAQNRIYGSTYDDFGRELNFIQLLIKGKGSRRLVFYIDKLELRGNVLDQSTYPAQCNTWWSDFLSRLADIKTQKHTQFNNLPAIPSVSGLTLSVKAQEYLNNINKARTNMTSLFGIIDGNQYFEPTVMDSLDELLGLYPSLVELLNLEINYSATKLAVYELDPTEYNRLTGSNIPCNLNDNPEFSARLCAGEFEPFSLFLLARNQVDNIKVNWTPLSGPGGTIPASEIDVAIAKVWYQNGYAITGYDGKWLTQELLVKNDDIIKVDETAKTNSLLVQRTDGTNYYLNISNTTAAVPRTVKIFDSNTLLPFSLAANKSKQLWITVHVPETFKEGVYTGSLTITADAIGTVKTVQFSIEVLPFKLAPSKLDYSIFYHGYVNDYTWDETPFTSFGKNRTQMAIELKDMKDHGVLYPVMNQSYNSLGIDLTLRNEAGLPKDRLYSQTVGTGKPTSASALTSLKNEINSWKNKMAQYGYSNLYCYGIDEAVGSELLAERQAWQAVHEAGAKVFASGYYTHYDDMGDLLDLAVIQNIPRKEQADLYHSRGHKIYNYRNPMVGVEDPEVNRRNYGLVLWKADYDGVMNYAYQRNFKDIWNDFDVESNQPHPYRDHVYTYPITNGILRTIEWEGLREGVDDIRYISTLENKIDSLKALGKDVAEYEQFLNAIDPMQDMNSIRNAVIDKILTIISSGGSGGGGNNGDAIAPEVVNAWLINDVTLKVKYSEKINTTEALVAANYTITNGITVSKVTLDAAQTEATLTISPNTLNQTYTVTVANVKDVNGNLISTTKYSDQYTYSLLTVVLAAEDGVLANGAALKVKAGSNNANVAYCTSTSSTITLDVDIPAGGYWYVWGRFFFEGTTTSPNAFNIKVDSRSVNSFGNNKDNMNKWHWGGDGIVETGTPQVLMLGYISPGKHKLVISGKEPGATVMIDELVLSNISTYIPEEGNMFLFAENGTLANGATLKTYSGSLGSKVVYCTSTSSTITFNVNLSTAGNWYAWGRFYFSGSSSTQNAFSFRVDNGTIRTFGNNTSYFNKWHWGGDGRYTSGPLVKLPMGTLTAGAHKITIIGKEPGTNVMLDMVVLTNDPDYAPTDADAKASKGVINYSSEENILPERFELMQNFPNPFNPATTIKYALPGNSFVTLKIYDILGKEVATLINEEIAAGYHEVDFNASNLTSGMYIYSIRTNEFSETRKMLLIK